MHLCDGRGVWSWRPVLSAGPALPGQQCLLWRRSGVCRRGWGLLCARAGLFGRWRVECLLWRACHLREWALHHTVEIMRSGLIPLNKGMH